jgi:hypothetical protein
METKQKNLIIKESSEFGAKAIARILLSLTHYVVHVVGLLIDMLLTYGFRRSACPGLE